MTCKKRLDGEERDTARLTRRIVDQRLAEPAHAMADAIEDSTVERARLLLDAIAVYQGVDLDDLYDGECDPEHEAAVHRIIEEYEGVGREI